MTAARRFDVLLPAVFLVTLAVFLPALPGQFLNWDDSTLFTKNLDYRGLGAAQLRWMFTTTLAGHYMPLTWLTLGLNYALGGMNPCGYHLLALLLHATNAALFYLVARRLLEAALAPAASSVDQAPPGSGSVRVGAAVAALFFSIHPQRVESVAWITERGTLLCGVFYLTAVLGYLRAVEGEAAGGSRRSGWAALSLASFAAALLSKGMALSLPVTLLILDVYPLRRWDGRWRQALSEKIPYGIVALLGAAVVLFARTRGAQWTSFSDFGLGARLAFAGYSFWFYPSRLIWPTGLSPLYEIPEHPGLLQWRFLGAILGVAIVTGAFVLLRHRFPGGLASWTHSAVVVAPVSGLAHSGIQLVSDRYSYLATLGFVLIAGYAVPWASRQRRLGRLSRGVAAVGAVATLLTLVALALGTWGQSGIWRDSETLWRWAAEQDPSCAMCQAILGEAIVYGPDGGRARLDEGEAHVRRAIVLRPTMPLPYFTLGTMLLLRGHYSEAEASLKAYMQISPRLSQGPTRLALIYLVEDRPADAVPLLLRAQDLAAGTAGSIHALPLDRSEGDPDALFSEALRLLGNSPEDLEYLGQALLQRGKGDRAVAALRRAVALAPEAPGPRFWLIKAYRATGQDDQARGELAVLRHLDPAAEARLGMR
jgi:Flp pilus assembly protein TadD